MKTRPGSFTFSWCRDAVEAVRSELPRFKSREAADEARAEYAKNTALVKGAAAGATTARAAGPEAGNGTQLDMDKP